MDSLAIDRTGEAELLARLRQGHAKAFEQLMRTHNRLLFRAARGIVADDAEAQDAVQETWLRAFVALHSFRGESSLATWLTRIAINQALMQQRRAGRLVAWHDDDPAEEADMAPADTDPVTPEELAFRNQVRRLLEEAIDRLPAIYRCVFLLRAVQGLSVEDTAAALEVSGDVVKTRYLRARGLLRSQLGAAPGAPWPLVHDFQGRRCDETIRQVLARLRAMGLVRGP
jgi:RNA polymerase sigma-70 factor (ECF subfamily)